MSSRQTPMHLLVVFTVALIGGCSRSSPRVPSLNSHAQMLEALEHVRLETPFGHPYLGTAQRVEGEKRLASLPKHGFEAERFSLHCVLSHQNLVLGNGDATVEHLDSALELLPYLAGRVSPEMESVLKLPLIF